MDAPLNRDRFAAALSELRSRYWDSHPFHLRLHAGQASADDIRRWVANRWYYQSRLARKNAAIISNCPDEQIRRDWLARVTFHDGNGAGEGGLHDWLALAEAVGLSAEEVRDERHVVRGTRFAVDGYLHFCQTRPWIEAVAAALTEMFSPQLMTDRVSAWELHYEWIKPAGLGYFAKRIPLARQDSHYTLGLVLDHCVTRPAQDAALSALAFKCDVLGGMLDAIDYAGTTSARPSAPEA
ncbi:pyrroloquinoline-quinone synthase PqqC [Nakamurella lactea]|uniref:pyrroloquinoline-quinone synthase PqqC n=1 Tax=Nakamurella lactea TaxID=459515 RepID=UPI0004197CFE|nr:pyrroloquinoline-quinone synthase PqqC [Nakamurella lactea]